VKNPGHRDRSVAEHGRPGRSRNPFGVTARGLGPTPRTQGWWPRDTGARFPTTGQLYRASMRTRTHLSALLAGVLLCGCGASAVVRPTPSTSHQGPGGNALITALETHCGAVPTARFSLGRETAGPLIGNTQPLAVTMTDGSSIVLSARFDQRHLGPFDIVGGGLGIRCMVEVTGPEGGPAAVLTARSPGVASVSTSTDDCSACAVIPLSARITVVGQ